MHQKNILSESSLSRKTAIIFLILTGILWSTGGFIIKTIPWPSLTIAGLRSGITFILLYSYSRPKFSNFGKYTWGGAFAYTLMVVCFVIGNKMTTAGNVILIQFSAPVYVAIFSFSFLGEKSTKIDWFSIFIILIGLGCFFIDDLSFNQLWGNIFALLSGFGFAGLTLFMRKQKDGRPIDTVILGNLITFLLCFPFYGKAVPFEIEHWLMITFLGVVQLGFAYILYSIAIKYLSALDAIIYPVVEPIFNPIFAFLFLGEHMGVNALIGGTLVLSGVMGRGIIQNPDTEDLK